MIYNPPKLEGATVEEYLANARLIVRWAGENLPEARNAMARAAHQGLLMHESQTLLAAVLVTRNCEYFNRLMSAEIARPIQIVVPAGTEISGVKEASLL